MGATIRCYAEVNLTINGEQIGWGKDREPFYEATITGDSLIEPRRIVIAAGETKIIWDYNQTRDFNLLWGGVLPTGFGYIAVKWDAPVSSVNLAPSGTAVRWRMHGRSCVAPMMLDSDDGLVSPAAADDVGEDVNGLPKILTGLGVGAPAVAGKVYALAVKNPGSASITVELALAN